MPTVQNEQSSQATFQKLKISCIPLLGNSLLTPSSVPHVSKLLSDLISTLREVHGSETTLKPSIISYAFFPISSILRRNDLSSIPDRILEKLLIALSLLCEDWWWNLDETTWEQIFMLCGAILGGIDSKGKGKVRDDESREAATRCLWALLRQRRPEEDPAGSINPPRAMGIISRFQSHAQTLTFIPILGQTVDSLLTAAISSHLPLQRASLQVLHVLIDCYLPGNFVPSVFPGIVSTMSKIALGIGVSKGWANGDIVAAALLVMQTAIVRSIGDDDCAQDGAVRGVDNLEDLADLMEPVEMQSPPTTTGSPYATVRTAAWVRGTASQLHIAMNSLTPLVNHPTPSALLALVDFSDAVLSTTTLTVPQSQPLLLSFLLSLTCSGYESVSLKATGALRQMLTLPSGARHTLLQVLMQISRDNLAALPRLVQTHSDSKVEHAAGLIESVCSLAATRGATGLPGIAPIAVGVGKLLGPNGGIEKWGWSLLFVLEFTDNPITVTKSYVVQHMIETDTTPSDHVPFPELTLTHVTSRAAHIALERMFRAMGLAAGDDCLFAIDWFLGVGFSGRGRRAVAALWCACQLLEGVAGVSLSAEDATRSLVPTLSKRVDKLARGIAKRVADISMDPDDKADEENNAPAMNDGDGSVVEHVKGMLTVRATPSFNPSSAPTPKLPQPMLHRALLLQLLSISAGILEARFTPLLLHTLYPILHCIVSESTLVSTTAIAALNFITRTTSYASPANLLLSNFDYALDAVSRHLSRRWLDIDATKILALLIRLVGRDIVQKAGDVVEECFDRLDEFHGYEIIVDGLVEVLTEVVKVVGEDDESKPKPFSRTGDATASHSHGARLDNFLHWFMHRHDQTEDNYESNRDTSYPREAWGPKSSEAGEQQDDTDPGPDPNAEPPPTPSQALTKQIVSRSLYFLTHGSPVTRARILMLLSAAVPVLPESALLPSIHHAWPFILNRFSDQEPFVVSAAASLVESLAVYHGDFMYRKVWDDIWPRVRRLVQKLEAADATNALARRGRGAVGTESAYTHSHRLYRSLMITMTTAVRGVHGQDPAIWDVVILFRRFLHNQAHDELQRCARDLYSAVASNNEDAVWLALSATQGKTDARMAFLVQKNWDIGHNVALIFAQT